MLPILLPHNSRCGFKPQSNRATYESVRRCRTRTKLWSTALHGLRIKPSNWRIMKMNHTQSNSKPTATDSLFRRAVKRFTYICVAGTLLLTASSAWAAGYHWTNLVSDIPGLALHTDPNLVNPWGL